MIRHNTVHVVTSQYKILFKSLSDIFNTRCAQKILCRMSSSTNAPQPQTITKKNKEAFLEGLPSILDTVSNNKKFLDVPEAGNWLKKILEYNLIGGKKSRGITTLLAYEMFEKPENINEVSIQSAKILGWCVEMLQAYLVILDDIVDSSSTRRGALCWYRLPEVGLGAINDALLIYSSMFQVIKTQIGKETYYTNILDLFNEAVAQTFIGQHLDVTMAKHRTNDYSLFTMDRYNSIVTHKTAYYTFKLPICLGLLLANNTDPAKHKIVENICMDIGKFFQVQDDYIDCFGDEAVSGKKGTDIQEGKCSWLAVAALRRCSEAQRLVFGACYGSAAPAHVARVRELYRALRLPELFARAETDAYEALLARARALPPDLSPQLFVKLVDMIYKRSH